MKRRRWRWKRAGMVIEAAIIGMTVALLIILFAESRFDRHENSQLPLESVMES